MNEENKKVNKRKIGRNPKNDRARFRYSISLTEEEHAAFLSRFDKSGMTVKAHFITTCIFDKPIRVVKLDKATMDYYMRLTTFYSQFRAIGVNYNQAVKTLHTTFTEKKALVFLSKLEKSTLELIILSRQIIELTKELEARIYVSEEPKTVLSDTDQKKQ